jgi:ATP-dependent Clp protease, protease subunit
MGIPAIQPTLIQQNRPPAFISFTAEINPNTVELLLATAANCVAQGHPELHLLLSTPGGSVMHGITAYNVLRGLPIPVITHNVGNVDSIGTVIYLAGERRYACPQTTFMLHGVAFGTQGPMQFFEKTLAERLASVQADQARIADIYRERAGITPEESERFFLGESTIGAPDALRRGLVHELRDVQIPAGSPVLQLVFKRQ